MADVALSRFRSDDGGFYDTSDDHEDLIVRPRNMQDNVTPSGNAMMAKAASAPGGIHRRGPLS